MPAELVNVEWLNLNGLRRYPLAVQSTCRDTSGEFTIPTSFLLGLDLPVSRAVAVDDWKFFVRSVAVMSTGFAIVVGYAADTGTINAATAFIPRAGHLPQTPYTLGGVGDFADSIGKVVIGRLGDIDKQPAGVFEFDLAGARIDPDCIRPILEGVSGLVVVNGTQRSPVLQNVVELVAQSNFQLTPIVVEGQDPQILFSAIKGEGLDGACVCDGSDTAPPIRRFNGIPGTPTGDFYMLGNDCMQIDGIANGLKFRDVCSKPCCGCKELAEITTQLERFGSEATSLSSFVSGLEAAVNTMDQVVLGSKLGDRGCVQCS